MTKVKNFFNGYFDDIAGKMFWGVFLTLSSVIAITVVIGVVTEYYKELLYGVSFVVFAYTIGHLLFKLTNTGSKK